MEMKTPPVGWKLIGYYHKALSGDAIEDDFFFADAINGDCPDCHPCYIDESVTIHPTPPEYKAGGWDEKIFATPVVHGGDDGVIHAMAQHEELESALEIAAEGKSTGLLGAYPMAAQVLSDEVRRLRNKLAEWEKLGDPVTLHANLLQGIPCRLDRSTFLHLAGDETNGTEGCDPVGSIKPPL